MLRFIKRVNLSAFTVVQSPIGKVPAVDNKPRVFITRRIMQEALDLIDQSAQMEVWPEEEPPSPAVLRQKAAEADGILTNIMDRVDVSAAGRCPKSEGHQPAGGGAG